MPQKRREEFLNADSKAEKKEQNENGTQDSRAAANMLIDSRAAANMPTHGQVRKPACVGRVTVAFASETEGLGFNSRVGQVLLTSLLRAT